MDREPHFLDDFVQELKDAGEYGSDDKLGMPWYNPHGDCVMFLSANEGVVADRIDEYLTIYRSGVDNRAIGFQIKDVKGLMVEFNYDSASVMAELEHDEVRSVTLSLMLLQSLESGAKSHRRVMAYAEAMTKLPEVPDPGNCSKVAG